MLKLTSIIILMTLFGCAVTPIAEESDSYVCWKSIYRNDREAQTEAEGRIPGGTHSETCIALADRYEAHQVEEARKGAELGRSLGIILKNATR
jgi:hypothetical protein